MKRPSHKAALVPPRGRQRKGRPSRVTVARWGLPVLLGLSLLLGCSSKRKQDVPRFRQPPPALPTDRLSSDELQASTVVVFGLPVPVGMKIVARYPDTVMLEGRVSPEALANYVRKHISKTMIEMGAARTVYDKVTINGGPEGRVFRIEIGRRLLETTMSVEDITRPVADPGLTPAQRWESVGMTPTGKLLNPNAFN